MRHSALVLIQMLALALAGCSALGDSEAMRLCRSLLPALEATFDRFEIVRTDDLTARPSDGVVLRLAYRAERSGTDAATRTLDRQRIRTLICSFAPTTGNVAPRLTSVVADRGPLGPARLHALQRYWIDSGLAARADPLPIAMLARAPELPPAVAFAAQTLAGGLPAIGIYALLASAYALIYGLVGRINLAFGELATLAGYGAFLGYALIGDGHLAAAILAAVVVGLFIAAMHGGALGRLVLVPLAPAPGQHLLIATIGLSIAWQEAIRLAQGAGNRWISPLLSRPLGIARAGDFVVTVTPMSLIVAAVAGVAAAALVAGLARSRFGMAWRAAADDPTAAAMLGIDVGALLVRTMALSALLAGLGGVLTTLHYGGVGFSGGLVVGLKALIAAIIGGIGSVGGALAGALVVGFAEAVWSALAPIEYRDTALFVGLVLVLWLKPTGLGGDTAQADGIRR